MVLTQTALSSLYPFAQIDLEVLARQVAEKRAAMSAKREHDAAYAQLALDYDRAVQELQRQVDEKRREHARELLRFRSTQQLKETAREFDLNDPKVRNRPCRRPPALPCCPSC